MKQKGYSVNVSDRAAKMLASHAAFLAQVNRSAAERLVASFEEAAKSLKVMPHRCSWLKDRYMIVFQIKDNMVYIEYILDCRQDNSFIV